MATRGSLQIPKLPPKHSSSCCRAQLARPARKAGGRSERAASEDEPAGPVREESGTGMSGLRLLVGTSGFSYKEWKGPFYPEKLPAREMLAYYAGRLPIVEINNTFYRLPRPDVLAGWRAQVPPTFRFAIKAARRITHLKRLKDCAGELGYLLETLAALGPALGSVLFQLPPFFKRDVPTLQAFVALLPEGAKAAFEFRHDSWLDSEVFALLASRDFALVVSETDEKPARELPWTADWTYLRLRKSSYPQRELEAWLDRLVAGGLKEAQVFFKHEDEAAGPRFAEQFLALAAQRDAAP
jgi:uncharacterized protein YecE (DUF72 family)